MITCLIVLAVALPAVDSPSSPWSRVERITRPGRLADVVTGHPPAEASRQTVAFDPIPLLFGLYRWLFSSQDIRACNLTPSCSRFSQQALAKCGLVRGILLTGDRLQRDHVFIGDHYPRELKTGRLYDPVETYCPGSE